MARPKILVTGATGQTGGVVVSQLLEAGYPVRAMVRREDQRSAALKARGVEIAVADMCDAERVNAAMQGVQRAYWLPPYDPSMLDGAAVFAAAAKDAKIESIVSLSQWLASPSHPAFLTRQHWVADRLFAALPDIALTMVTPGFFADVPYLVTIGMAAHLGVYPWLFGDSETAPASILDIGRVAAAALMDPARHGGRTYRPTGPEVLDGRKIAGILGKVFEREVRLVPLPFKLFLKAAHLIGQPMALLSNMAFYGEEHRRGAFAMGAPNDDVERATGRRAETFEELVRRHAVYPQNRRSAANTRSELLRSLVLPFASTPNIKRYVKGLQLHEPAAPQYCAESPIWRREHGFAQLVDDEASTHARPTSSMKLNAS